MKQTLRITHLIGRSQNAIQIQIAVALIAYLIVHMLQQFTKMKDGFLEFIRLIRTNLMHRKDVLSLLEIPKPKSIDSRQITFEWAIS